ncbi:MAG: DUF4214 domain-containing protein [Saccharofermentans sp.]|nr:DUF4214 domain-containing protein [Saccharofermentans sp.]
MNVKFKRSIAFLLTVVMLVGFMFTNVMADNTGVADFVERLYTIALERSSDPSGKALWIDELESHRRNGGEVAAGFFFSAEFQNSGVSNEEYVTRLYKTFMNRNPDSAGFDMWTGLLAEGMSREYVFSGFVNSTEWANICASYGIISGGCAVADQYVGDFVERMYTKALGRASEDYGRNFWTNQIISGANTGSEVAYGFFFSSEFMNSNYTNEEYVKRLYRVFFNREYDQAGFDLWVGLLNDGASREYVFNGFAGSAEWANLCAIYGINQGTANFTGNTTYNGSIGGSSSGSGTGSTSSEPTELPLGCVAEDPLSIPSVNPLNYTYEIYPLVFNLNYMFYVKTDNPDPYSFRLVDENTVYSDEVRVVQPVREGFADVLYENTNTYRVNGGYICTNYMEDWEFFDVSDGIDGGNLKLQVRTKYDLPYSYNVTNYQNNYRSWQDTNVTVYCQPLVDIYDYLIQNYTSPNNDFFTNMDAVQSYVRTLSIYPRSLYDDSVSTGYYACLAASPYPELSLNRHYESTYTSVKQNQLILYANPFALHSQSYPGLMANLALRLNPNATVASAGNHAYVNVSYNGVTRSYGGAGSGGPGEIFAADVTKIFTFSGGADDYFTQPLSVWSTHYLDLCSQGNARSTALAESLSLEEFRGNSGAWIRVAYEGRRLGDYSYAYVCGNYYTPSMSGPGNSLENCWIDGRYVNRNNVYEPMTFAESLKNNPSFLVKDTTFEVHQYNGSTTTHTGSVLYRYDSAHDCWVGCYSYDQALKFNPSLILTRNQVLAMNLDYNYNVVPSSGYIYDSTAAPGTPFSN